MTIIYENVSKYYDGKAALKDACFEIEDKKCYAFVGDEGSGKTTAIRLFVGLEKPDEGEIRRMGDYKYPTLQSSYVSQEGRLNPKKNAIWNVRKFHRRASKGRAIEELTRFLPEDRINLPVGELTLIEKRLVELVGALFVPSDFIILDDTLVGMDESLRKRVLDHLMDAKGSRPLIIAQRTDEGVEFAKKISFVKP